MDSRIGLGPVYTFERLSRSRRWQTYAGRTLFGAMLLTALGLTWKTSGSGRPMATYHDYAEIGAKLALGVLGTQIALMMLVAPAATAGAICLEKQRGTLADMLVTDLSDGEIILGKLAARLQPVLSLMLSALGVLAISSLLGGIVPEAIFAAFLISAGVAVLGCSLALMFSVWGSRTHEVLLATYSVLGLWLLAMPLANGLGFRGRGGRWSATDWIEWSDPFRLAFRPSWYPGTSNLWASVIFLLVTVGISAILVTVAMVRLRPVAANPKLPKKRKPVGVRSRRRLRDLLPGPSLDGNPVLWREWHRGRASRGLLSVLVIYYSVSVVFCILVVAPWFNHGQTDPFLAAWVNAWVGNVGLLILCVTAATSLSDERVRGSLDVLMTTPLSTRAIVWGKWWGAAQAVAPLAILPSIVAFATAARTESFFAWILFPLYIVSTGLMIVSLGLALATWQSKASRAITLSVVIFLTLTAGWLFITISSSHSLEGLAWGYLSPFFALAEGTFSLGLKNTREWEMLYWGMLVVSMTWLALSAGLFFVTVATFDRCLGRVSEKPLKRRYQAANPKPVALSEIPYA